MRLRPLTKCGVRQDNLSLPNTAGCGILSVRPSIHPTSLIGTWGQTHQSRALLFNLAAAAPGMRRPLIIARSLSDLVPLYSMAFVGSRRGHLCEARATKCPIIVLEICTWDVRESRFQIKCLLYTFSWRPSIASAREIWILNF